MDVPKVPMLRLRNADQELVSVMFTDEHGKSVNLTPYLTEVVVSTRPKGRRVVSLVLAPLVKIIEERFG